MTDYASIAVALLAAGRSVRFGSDKLLAEIDGEALGVRAAKSLMDLGFGHHLAVCKSDRDLPARYAGLGFSVIVNEEPERGQASSLHLAVEAATATKATALLVALADMPFVSINHLAALASAYDGAIIASTYGDAPMPPAIFPRESWPALLKISGDAGARALLKGARVVAAAQGELLDIDTQGDLPASK